MTIKELSQKYQKLSNLNTLPKKLADKYSQIKIRQEALSELNNHFLDLTDKVQKELSELEIQCNKEFQTISEKNNKINITNKWQQVAKDCLKDIDGCHGIGNLGAALAQKYSNGVSSLKCCYPEILDKFLAIKDWDSLQKFHSFCQDYNFVKTMKAAAECGETFNFPEQWFEGRKKFNDNWYNHPVVKQEYEREQKELDEMDDCDYDDDYDD